MTDILLVKLLIVPQNKVFQGKGIKISPSRSGTRVSERFFTLSKAIINLSANRFHRKLTGASMLTRRQNGRCRKRSSIEISAMLMVTQYSCHLLVANSRSDPSEPNFMDWAWSIEGSFDSAPRNRRSSADSARALDSTSRH